MGTAVAAILGFIGVIIGAFWLASIWGAGTEFSSLYQDHPNIEVFGFLTLFILGASLTIIPRFKGRKLVSNKLAWESVILVSLGNLLVLFTSTRFLVYDDLLILGGALIALVLIGINLGRPSGPLALAEPFMWLSVISLFLAVSLKTYFDYMATNSSWDSFAFLEIIFFSFPTMMIFGISTRTIHFRVARMNKKVVSLAFYLAVMATSVAAIASILSSGSSLGADLLDASSILYLACVFAFVLGISAFRDNMLTDHVRRMNERDRTRYLYFGRAYRIAVSWIVLAVLLAVVYALFSQDTNLAGSLFWVRDAFIHSMAIGFLGSMIAAYAPILLPAVISGRAPYHGLTNLPLYLVVAGNIWRVGSDLLRASGLLFANLFTGYSGILIVLGVLWFLKMNHTLK